MSKKNDYFIDLSWIKDINTLWSILFSCYTQYPDRVINLEAIKRRKKNETNKL